MHEAGILVNPAIRRATIDDLDVLVPLFGGYRQFYREASDPGLARDFLRERIERSESVIFIAQAPDGAAVGFVQLFPSFSSARAATIFILNDLFVAPAARRMGIGKALLARAAQFGREQRAVRLRLSTELTNTAAQALCESLGWKRETAFCDYNLAV